MFSLAINYWRQLLPYYGVFLDTSGLYWSDRGPVRVLCICLPVCPIVSCVGTSIWAGTYHTDSQSVPRYGPIKRTMPQTKFHLDLLGSPWIILTVKPFMKKTKPIPYLSCKDKHNQKPLKQPIRQACVK